MLRARVILPVLLAVVLAGASLDMPAFGQQGPHGPPAVGVVRVVRKPITETNEFIGRVQAVARVALVARVTAFLKDVDFKDGSEVKKGQALYRLDEAPFEADVDAKQAVIDQLKAQLTNADITLKRAQTLMRGPAGQQSNVDTALANQRALVAQVSGAQANLQTSKINLGYTRIDAPIDGKIGRTNVTPGNVVGPSSGTLATIVSQDPMYVTFPISVRTGLELRERYMNKGGFGAVLIRIRLPDGRIYAQTGKLDFVDNTISAATDTITLRGVIPNPYLPDGKGGDGSDRELADNEFVQVLLEGVAPVEVLAIPRAAVLSDQRGDYVYVVGPGNKAERRAVKLGQSTPAVASVISGLKEGEMVVSEGLQRVRPGQPVAPSPATPAPGADPKK